MKIAICDDQHLFIDELSTMINKILFNLEEDYNIETFNSGEELLKKLNNAPSDYDIIFLDILMGGITGMETAKKIRENIDNTPIVFFTSTPEFALEGYEVNAINYLLKPINFDKVKSILVNLKQDSNNTNNKFSFNVNNDIYSVDFNDINFFEVINRIVYIDTVSNDKFKNIGFYQKLDTLESELSEKGFIRSHRSYLVNMKNIKHISSESIIFLDGSEAPMSRRKRNIIKDEFLVYLSKHT